MDSVQNSYLKISAIAVVGCLLLAGLVFLAIDHDNHRDIDTEVIDKTRGGLVLDADYETFRYAGYVCGDQVTMAIGDNDPVIAILCDSRSESGYFEVYISYDESLGKMVLGQMFGFFDESYAGDVHIEFLRHIDRLDNLSNYGHKISYDQASSDEQFCNFREVTVGDIKSGTLYRSTDPLGSNRDGRAYYADHCAESAGIGNEINLCESAASIEKRISSGSLVSTYCLQLYRDGNVLFEEMKPSLFDNTEQFKVCFEYMLDNDGPFLIHCMEGKDRTGMYFILLEGICGATMEEVQADYMQTMVNFYNIVPGSDEYQTVEKMMCDRIIYLIANPDEFDDCLSIDWEKISISDIDINQVCKDYLVEQCGLSEDQISSLVTKLTA